MTDQEEAAAGEKQEARTELVKQDSNSNSSSSSSNSNSNSNVAVVSSQNQAQDSHRPQIHPHFIHNHESVKSSEQNLIEVASSSIPRPKIPSVASRTEQTANLSGTKQKEEESSTGASSGDEAAEGQSASDSTNGSEEGGSEAVSEDKKKGGKKKKAAKKDRSNLRKGKWTVEEEEYTSRIIHHFSTGILTLPEGTTLRSYLAEKLKCDPMRITKKFAGASCLGKRVYHLCDRSQATVTDIEMAKAELIQLEHRFRLRVEHGQSGAPLPPQVIPSLPSAAPPIYAAPGHAAPAAVAASWLQSIASQMSAQATGTMPFAQNLPPQVQYQVSAPAPWQFATTAPQPKQWETVPTALSPSHSDPPAPPAAAPSQMQTATNEAITLAWAQAAASLTPALSQLAAANLQQHQQQLQKAYESQLQSYAQQQSQTQQPALVQQYAPAQLAAPTTIAFAARAPGQQIAPAPSVMAPPPSVPSIMSAHSFVQPATVSIAPQPVRHASSTPTPIAAKPPSSSVQRLPTQPPLPTQRVMLLPVAHKAPNPAAVDLSSAGRTKEEEYNGSMLMGFLTSLHKGFTEAKDLKDKEDRDLAEQKLVWANKSAAMAVMGESQKQESSSGGTSYPADSSPEDSQSDMGGKDPSSSEESDTTMDRPRGPPRKRHKTRVGEFTSRNVAAHTTRMDALHHAGQHQNVAYSPPAPHVNGVNKTGNS